MNSTTKRHVTPGFATLLTEGTNLGLATLIAEGDDAGYLPIAAVSTIAEGRELARQDFAHRAKQVAAGDDTFCPGRYKVWAQGIAGGGCRIRVLDSLIRIAKERQRDDLQH